DVLATGQAIMALKSAQISGLEVGADEMPRGLVALRAARSPGRWSSAPLAPAVRISSTIYVAKTKCPELDGEAAILLEEPPRWDVETNDYDQLYWATLALFQLDGPRGKRWREWDRSLVRT